MMPPNNNIRQAIVDFAQYYNPAEVDAIQAVIKPQGEVKAKIQAACEKIFNEMNHIPEDLKKPYVTYRIRELFCEDVDKGAQAMFFEICLKEKINSEIEHWDKTVERASPGLSLSQSAALDSYTKQMKANISHTVNYHVRTMWAAATANISSGIEKIREHHYLTACEVEKQDQLQKQREIADQMAKELQEEEALSKSKRKTGKKKPARKKKPIQKPVSQSPVAKPKIVKKQEKSQSTSSSSPIDIPIGEKKDLLFASFSNPSSKWRLHRRVSRWNSARVNEIRKFKDRDSRKQIVQQYRDLSQEELLKQRARHYLPRTERLLDKPFREIYTTKTERGFAMVAQFSYENEVTDGMIYVGCNDHHRIHHRYFHEKNFKQENANKFLQEDIHEVVTEWEDRTITETPEMRISEQEGIIIFDYISHKIAIFPIRPDLLKQELTSSY